MIERASGSACRWHASAAAMERKHSSAVNNHMAGPHSSRSLSVSLAVPALDLITPELAHSHRCRYFRGHCSRRFVPGHRAQQVPPDRLEPGALGLHQGLGLLARPAVGSPPDGQLKKMCVSDNCKNVIKIVGGVGPGDCELNALGVIINVGKPVCSFDADCARVSGGSTTPAPAPGNDLAKNMTKALENGSAGGSKNPAVVSDAKKTPVPTTTKSAASAMTVAGIAVLTTVAVNLLH